MHNPFVPSLLGMNNIGNTAPSFAACWTIFTELLPGNMLIKSVTILIANMYSPSLSKLLHTPHGLTHPDLRTEEIFVD
jgi:hypothetical protein